MTVVTECSFTGCCRMANLFVRGIPCDCIDCVFVTDATVGCCDGRTNGVMGNVGCYGTFVVTVSDKAVNVTVGTVVNCGNCESKVLMFPDT